MADNVLHIRLEDDTPPGRAARPGAFDLAAGPRPLSSAEQQELTELRRRLARDGPSSHLSGDQYREQYGRDKLPDELRKRLADLQARDDSAAEAARALERAADTVRAGLEKLDLGVRSAGEALRDNPLLDDAVGRVKPTPAGKPSGDAFDFRPPGPERFDFTPQTGPAEPLGLYKTPTKPGERFDFTPPPPPPLPVAGRAPVPQQAFPVAERFDPGFFEKLRLAYQGKLPEFTPLGKENGQERLSKGGDFSAQLEGIKAAAQAAGPGGMRSAGQVASAGLQVGESGLLGSGVARAAMAGGPQVAAVAMVLDAVVGKVTETFDDARKATQYFGAQARAVAGNDGIGLVSNAADRAAEQLDKIPIVGKAFASAVHAAVEPLRQVDQVAKVFVARGRELSQFDPRLAAASANADFTRMAADIREAQGPAGAAMARVIDSQSRFEVAQQRALEPLKTLLADRTADILDRLTPVIENVGRLTEVVINALPSVKTVEQTSTTAAEIAIPVFGLLKTVLERWLGEPKKADDPDRLNQIMLDVLGLDNGRSLAQPIADPAAVVPGPDTLLPLLSPH